jgi:hypothetical protein
LCRAQTSPLSPTRFFRGPAGLRSGWVFASRRQGEPTGSCPLQGGTWLLRTWRAVHSRSEMRTSPLLLSGHRVGPGDLLGCIRFSRYCQKWPAALAAPRRGTNDETYWILCVPADFGAPTMQ